MGWREFLDQFRETLGVSAVFAFGGAALHLWSRKETFSGGKAFSVVLASQMTTAGVSVVVHGMLGWNIFLAPVVGLVCGLIALPVIGGVIVLGERLGGVLPDFALAMLAKWKGGK